MTSHLDPNLGTAVVYVIIAVLYMAGVHRRTLFAAAALLLALFALLKSELVFLILPWIWPLGYAY